LFKSLKLHGKYLHWMFSKCRGVRRVSATSSCRAGSISWLCQQGAVHRRI